MWWHVEENNSNLGYVCLIIIGLICLTAGILYYFI
jgi:hypothetical protein